MTDPLDEFRSEALQKGPRCMTCSLLDPVTTRLGAEDLEKFRAALDAPSKDAGGLSNEDIARWLRRKGVPLSGCSVARHRRGACCGGS